MNLLDSIASFYQGGMTRAQRRAEEAEGRAEEAEKRTREAEGRAGKAEKRAEEAERRVEEAKRSTEQAESRAEEAERRAEQAERRAEEAERGSSQADSQGGDDLPLADYDSLNIRQISERLDELSVEEIRRLRDYEVRNKDRSTLVNRLNSRIEGSS
jgi:chromosome segregation ATPase